MDKKLIKILVGLGILIIIYLINISFQKKYEAKQLQLLSINKDNIYKIVISENLEAIELVRIDTMWSISANDTLVIKENIIQNLFEDMYNLEKQHLVTSKEENWKEYGVSPENGTHLALINADGETLIYFVFGKSETEYNRCFVRSNKDIDVYLLNQNILYQLQTHPTFWGEKKQSFNDGPSDSLIEPIIKN